MNNPLPDYYSLLAVPETASDEELKKAFRKLAFDLHPDRNPDNPESEQKFKAINEAYQTLSDPQKRQQYDFMRKNPQARVQHGPGFSEEEMVDFDPFQFTHEDFIREVFSRFSNGAPGGVHVAFGGRMNNAPMVHGAVDLTLKEVLLGKTTEVDVELAEDKVESGRVFRKINSFKVPVKVPPGMRGNTVIQTEVTLPNGTQQQINIVVRLIQDERFDVYPGGDLHGMLWITYPQALVGGTCTVELVDGRKEKIKIQKNTRPGQRIRLSGQGLPRSPKDLTRGDLYFSIQVEIPESITLEQEECLKNLQTLFEQQASKKPFCTEVISEFLFVFCVEMS